MDLSWGEAAANQVPQAGGINVQGSEEWLKWRGKGIGSSDAAVLLGWSPWKRIDQLYEEKLGLWKPTFGPHQRSAMERGKELEPKIRNWYEQNWRGGALFPDKIAEDSENPHRRASYDGVNDTFKNPEDLSIGRMIEIKAPNAKDHALAQAGDVPEKYIPQCQWLMMIGNIPWCDYVSFGSDGTYAVVNLKADAVLQGELKKRSDLFWKHVETKTPLYPNGIEWEKYYRPLSESVDLRQDNVFTPMPGLMKSNADEEISKLKQEAAIESGELEAIVAAAMAADIEAKAAVAKFEGLKEKLKQALGKQENMVCGEAVFGWQKRKGTVDYTIIPELIGLDLDQFRKPETRAFYFKRVDPVKRG